jgi:hypothetical protein
MGEFLTLSILLRSHVAIRVEVLHLRSKRIPKTLIVVLILKTGLGTLM